MKEYDEEAVKDLKEAAQHGDNAAYWRKKYYDTRDELKQAKDLFVLFKDWYKGVRCLDELKKLMKEAKSFLGED